jgi:hypothetical protein
MSFTKSSREEILGRCNFRLAAREIARFLEISDKMAGSQGGRYVYKEEFVRGWEKFAASPCFETANQFLEEAPDYQSVILDYFANCSPGGKFYRCGFCSAAEFPLAITVLICGCKT